MVGGFAGALLFISFLAGSTIIGSYVLAYAAHCILVVVQGTAAGIDEVQWPDDPILDWLVQSAALVGLTAILLIPAGILARALSDVWLENDPLLRTLLLAGPGLWLVFPVGLFSSLSASSRWVFFRPIIVWQLLRLFLSTMAVYLGSAILALLALTGWYATLAGVPWLLFVVAPLGAAAVLIYARMLGRLAWRIVQLKQPVPRKAVKKPARALRKKIKTSDPWAVPEPPPAPPPAKKHLPLVDDDEDVTEPYELATGDAVEEIKRPVRKRPLDAEELDALTGYTMAADPAPPAEAKPIAEMLRLPKDMDPAQRKPPAELKGVFGVLGFPWYATSLKAWIWLTAGNFALGFMLLGLVMFFPH